MAIATVLASKPTFIFPELNRVSNARNSFEGSLRGTVHVSLINAEVAKTVTSLLRCCLLLKTFCRVVTFLVAVETSEMTQVLASHVGNVGGIDTGDWGGVFPGSF